MVFTTTLPLEQVVAQIWTHITKDGQGHLLLGSYNQLRYGVGAPMSCGAELRGFSLPVQVENPEVNMVGYVPLFAVARSPAPSYAGPDDPPHVDLSIDYRGTTGPGDPKITPTVYEAPQQ